MKYLISEENGKSYIERIVQSKPVWSESDVLDIISLSFEHGINLLVLRSEALAGEFFNLRTGLAGAALQKFVYYNINTALVMADESLIKGISREFLAETNQSESSRTFKSANEAVSWLVK